MRWGTQTRTVLRLLLPVVLVVTIASPVATAEVLPTVYDVPVSHRFLEARRPPTEAHPDGEQIMATSLRFFPQEIDIHRGDILHFHSEIFLMPVVLIPPPWHPGRSGEHGWLAPENNIAHDLDDPWYFVSYDEDEVPSSEPQPTTKVNNRVVFPPKCGLARSAASPCVFPQTKEQLGTDDPSAPLDPVRGALGSGVRPDDPTPTELFVRIEAEPGTTVYAVMLSAIGMNMKINVVADDHPATDPTALADAKTARIEADELRIEELDAQYASYRVWEPLTKGARRWHSLAGIERDGVTILEAYPHQLRIAKGDQVRWSSAHLGGQFHTVSFPLDRLRGYPLFEMQCDLDGDSGRQPDQPASLPAPLFCPGGPTQLEIDLGQDVVYPSGDGAYKAGTDFETSGILGAAPHPAPGYAPYDVRFPVASPSGGFAYGCLLHPLMEARVHVA